MCIRHHINCSVESVTERGAEVLPFSSECGRCRQVVETSTHTCLSRASRLEDTVPDGLGGWHIETPNAQYITYNIKKWGCLTTCVVQRKRPWCTWPGVVSSLPPSPNDVVWMSKIVMTSYTCPRPEVFVSFRNFLYSRTFSKHTN